MYARLIEQRLIIAEIQLQNVVEESVRTFDTEIVSEATAASGVATGVVSVEHSSSESVSVGVNQGSNDPSTFEESDGWL